MKNKLSKILMSMSTLIVCSCGCFMFSKLYVASCHLHPPDEVEINKTRKELQKATGMKNPPYIKKEKKKPKYEHPKRFKVHHN